MCSIIPELSHKICKLKKSKSIINNHKHMKERNLNRNTKTNSRSPCFQKAKASLECRKDQDKTQ